jgi:hypothetical protein
MASQLFFTTATGSVALSGGRGGSQRTSWSIRDARLNWAKEYILTLTNVLLPNLVLPINQFNNKIYVSYNGGAVTTVTVPVGVYNPTTFATAVTTALASVSANFSCSVNSTTYFATLAVSSGSYQLVAGVQSIYESLGFSDRGAFDPYYSVTSQTVSPFLQAVATFTGTSSISISGTKYVDICSNLATNNYSASSTNNILARIPMTVGFGNLVVYEPANEQQVIVTSQANSHLEIYLMDDRGNEFQLPDNSPVSLTFKIEILK